MTDLHTHILPGMDDGAKTPEISLEMLRMERDQGVDTVVLTPHFYRDRERPGSFLKRRSAAAERLRAALEALGDERSTLPRLELGAEVAWVPNLADMPELPQLCMGQSRYLLLELPFYPWNEQMIHQIYDLMGRTGVTPVIAHMERYVKIQKPAYLAEVLSLGVPVQVSGEPMLHALRQGRALKLLRKHQAQLIASDCHDTVRRPPDLGPAMDVVRRKLGEARASEVKDSGRMLLLR